MPIDFFQETCKTESHARQFGLCDNPPPAEDPAYIDETNSSAWTAEIQNINEVKVEFYAVDHCVEVRRPNAGRAKRCDGILKYNNNLTFVELKDRGTGNWISGGRKQLTETVYFVRDNHDITAYTNIDARICNKQRPLAITSNTNEIQNFKDDTGFLLTIDRTIII